MDLRPGVFETAVLIGDGSEPVRGVVTIEQDRIDVTTEREPDPGWVHVDTQGHEHRWMTGLGADGSPEPLRDPVHQSATLPSLAQVPDTEPHWCEECLGEYQPWHYECVQCGDVVSPALRNTVGRRYIPGLKYMSSIDVEALLPLDAVTVTLLTEPAWIVDVRVVSRESARESSGARRVLSRLVPVREPRAA